MTKNTFYTVMEQALTIKEECKQALELIPSEKWEKFDPATQETIFSTILDKSLKLANIYEDLSNALYFSTLPTIMMYEPADINKKGNTYTNKGMTTSLLEGHVTFKDKNGYFEGNDLLRDLLFHLYMNVNFLNIIKKSKTPRDGYNYIFTCTKHKLVDLCREKNKEKKIKIEPLDAEITTKSGEVVERQYASDVNVENAVCEPSIEVIFNNALESLLPHLIPVLKKHPERLLSYLNNMTKNSSSDLLENISLYGYKATLKLLTDKLFDEGIDIRYLNNEIFIYKVEPSQLKAQHVYNWLNRMHRDFKENKKIKKLIEEFVLECDSFKKLDLQKEESVNYSV